MKHSSFKLSSEQTLRLQELRAALVEALPPDAAKEVEFSAGVYGCGGTCSTGCGSGCAFACYYSCKGGCKGSCSGRCTSCTATCTGACVNTCYVVNMPG